MTFAVTDVHAEYRRDVPWVGVPAPRLSWKTVTDTPDWLQAGAEVEVTRRGVTEVFAVSGRDSVLIEWPAEPLVAREWALVRVRVVGSDGGVSPWSEPREVRSGFLAPGEWSALMIGADARAGATPGRARHEFRTDGTLRSATLYATAQGAYQAYINGVVVDDEILKPGWTSYQWRLVHETTDVTALLRDGLNVIGIDFAGAWYSESYGFAGNTRVVYGERPAVAAQIVLEYDDGRIVAVATGPQWMVSTAGPRRASGIYAGETYDAQREQPGWSEPGFDEGWPAAEVRTEPFPIPVPRTGPAVRATQELAVREVITAPSGRTVVDFGQNLVGHVRIRVRGERGSTITIRHAEVLERGELCTRPLRAARATTSYTLAGGEGEVWEPAFTFQGFRYAEISGWPGPLDPADVTAVVVHSDMERTGFFDCSHPQLNRLHENVVWGLRGNFLSIPTDCPQRDERLGWTGDLQVFSPTASFIYDVRGLLGSWLEDLWLEQQHAGGAVTNVVPSVIETHPSAAWGDAATIVPSVLHERFADMGVLRRQFDSMAAWCGLIESLAGPGLLWEQGPQFGDWLDPTAPPENPSRGRTEAALVATAYFARSVELTARAAERLGRSAEGSRLSELRQRIGEAFRGAYVAAGDRMSSDAQTAYAVAIQFELYEGEAQRAAFGRRLAELVQQNDYRIGTGFVGTPLIEDALVGTGEVETAARLLLNIENPSWLYPVTMGATTIWERWDSMLPDGSINPGEMTSFNHYALGAVADWLHRGLCGLAPGEPGYRSIVVEPHPIDGIEYATAQLQTPYGMARSGWRRDGESMQVEATIPPNTTAVVRLPWGLTDEVGSGVHQWTARITEG